MEFLDNLNNLNNSFKLKQRKEYIEKIKNKFGPHSIQLLYVCQLFQYFIGYDDVCGNENQQDDVEGEQDNEDSNNSDEDENP